MYYNVHVVHFRNYEKTFEDHTASSKLNEKVDKFGKVIQENYHIKSILLQASIWLFIIASYIGTIFCWIMNLGNLTSKNEKLDLSAGIVKLTSMSQWNLALMYKNGEGYLWSFFNEWEKPNLIKFVRDATRI